jgi:hypothetical protein
VFCRMLETMITHSLDARRYVVAARTQMSDAYYRKSRGMDITPHEKSALLLWGQSGLDVGHGQTTEEFNSNRLVKISCNEHESDIVHRLWADLTSVCLAGPFSRFYSYSSLNEKQDVVLSVVPHGSTLRQLYGEKYHRGWFSRFDYTSAREVEWARDSQLAAAVEAGVGYNTIDSPLAGIQAMRVGTASSKAIPTSYDETDIDFNVSKEHGEGRINNFEWQDPFLSRMVTTDNGADAPGYVYAQALTKPSWGDAEAELLDMEKFTVVDEHASAEYLGGRSMYRPRTKEMEVWMPSRAINSMEARTLDLTPIMKGSEALEFMPAFTEYTQFPQSVLHKEQPELEKLAALQFNMRPTQKLQATFALRTTINYALLTNIFGEGCLNQSKTQIVDIARLVSARRY